MLTALAWLPLAQAVAIAPLPKEPTLLAEVPAIEGEALPRIPNEFTEYQQVRPLPGQLNDTPVFNSNSPEVIQQDGILLSTFPPRDMANAAAHLDYAFNGRFDFFAHHIARGRTYRDRRTLFVGGVVYNPSDRPVTLRIEQGVSYLSHEAPFRNLPSLISNADGRAYAGPGSRTVTDVLQGRRQAQWPQRVIIPPRQAYLLMNAPIPLRRLPDSTDATLPPGSTLSGNPSGYGASAIASVAPQGGSQTLPSNGRTVLLQMSSDGPVYAATLAMYAPRTSDGMERAPTLTEWLQLLVDGNLAGPRDIPPTNPDEYQKLNGQGRFYYGRVAGVAEGSRWEATASDIDDESQLTIPALGRSVSYVLSTVDHNTFGTDQIQSAPMLARYPDTAYRAHGNYGVHYAVTLPLYNDTDATRSVVVKLQTPLQDETLSSGLRFLRNPPSRVFFRGTVRVRYQTESGTEQSRYVHIVQHQGQEGEPILRLDLPPQARRNVVVEFIYPPDATPPQVVTVSTIGGLSGITTTEASSPKPEADVSPTTSQEATVDSSDVSEPEFTELESVFDEEEDADAEAIDSTSDSADVSTRSMDEAGNRNP